MKPRKGRKPTIPVGELSTVIRLGLFYKFVVRNFSALGLSRRYGVTQNVIAFIQKGGRYANYARAYAESVDTETQAEAKPETTGDPIEALLLQIIKLPAGKLRVVQLAARLKAEDPRL